jgi:hypothetical protein
MSHPACCLPNRFQMLQTSTCLLNFLMKNLPAAWFNCVLC